MKTRYKIIIVIGIFVLFYVQLPLMWKQCDEVGADCTVLMNLMHWTRMGMFSHDLEWSGTADGIEQDHTIGDYLRINQNFVLTMIAAPLTIIAGIVIWDKRK